MPKKLSPFFEIATTLLQKNHKVLSEYFAIPVHVKLTEYFAVPVSVKLKSYFMVPVHVKLKPYFGVPVRVKLTEYFTVPVIGRDVPRLDPTYKTKITEYFQVPVRTKIAEYFRFPNKIFIQPYFVIPYKFTDYSRSRLPDLECKQDESWDVCSLGVLSRNVIPLPNPYIAPMTYTCNWSRRRQHSTLVSSQELYRQVPAVQVPKQAATCRVSQPHPEPEYRTWSIKNPMKLNLNNIKPPELIKLKDFSKYPKFMDLSGKTSLSFKIGDTLYTSIRSPDDYKHFEYTKDFTIKHDEYGSGKWLGIIDIRGVNLSSTVKFKYGEVDIDTDKYPMLKGEVRVQINLIGIDNVRKKFAFLNPDSESEIIEHLSAKLIKRAMKKGAIESTFENFIWKFTIEL